MNKIENYIADRMFGDPEFDSHLCPEVRAAELAGTIIDWELVSQKRLEANESAEASSTRRSSGVHAASELDFPTLSSDFQWA